MKFLLIWLVLFLAACNLNLEVSQFALKDQGIKEKSELQGKLLRKSKASNFIRRDREEQVQSSFRYSDGRIFSVGYYDGKFSLWVAKEDGKIDLSFGSKGIVLFNFNEELRTLPYGEVLILDSKIYVLMSYSALRMNGDGSQSEEYVGSITRLKIDGSLDVNFANGGVLEVDRRDEMSDAILLRVDKAGRLVLALNYLVNSNYTSEVVRVLTSGQIDSSFGSSGFVALEPNSGRFLSQLEIDDSGNIYAFLDARFLSASKNRVWKMTPTGVADLSFGAGAGYVEDLFDRQVVGKIQDGYIYTAGNAPASFSTLRIVRRDLSGSIDSVYSNETSNINLEIEGSPLHAVQVQDLKFHADGSVLLFGSAYELPENSNSGFALVVKFKTDGSLDSNFGNAGYATVQAQSKLYEIANSVIEVPTSNKYIVISSHGDGFGNNNHMFLWKINSDGQNDSSFGNSGTVVWHEISEREENGYNNFLMADRDGNVFHLEFVDGKNAPSAYIFKKFSGLGDQIMSFGTQGRLYIESINADIPPFIDENIYIVGESGDLFSYSRHGQLRTTWGNQGKVNLPSFQGDVQMVSFSDNLYIIYADIDDLGKSAISLFKLDSKGAPDLKWGIAGVQTVSVPFYFNWRSKVRFLSDGSLLITGQISNELAIAKIDKSGSLSPSFGNQGISILSSFLEIVGLDVTDSTIWITSSKNVNSEVYSCARGVDAISGQQIYLKNGNDLCTFNEGGGYFNAIRGLADGRIEIIQSIHSEDDSMTSLVSRVYSVTADEWVKQTNLSQMPEDIEYHWVEQDIFFSQSGYAVIVGGDDFSSIYFFK